MGDLPDFTSEVETGTMKASSILNGADAAKAAAPAVGDIYIATDTGKGYICLAAGAWTYFLGMIGLVTRNDVTAARAIDGTVYTNATGKLKLCVLSIELQVESSIGAGYSLVIAASDDNANPVTTVDQTKLQAKGGLGDDIETFGSVVFFVVAGEKYKVTGSALGSGIAPDMQSWIEYDLF